MATADETPAFLSRLVAVWRSEWNEISENLTPDQEKRLRAAGETIKREFRYENQGH
jgi:hypothetical protein